MRHLPIPAEVFATNRARLAARMAPNSLAVVNANDVLPTNADGSLALVPNSDLFWLSGIEQEESILLVYPDSFDEQLREVLFLRQPTDELKVWEGHKHTKEAAREISGIRTIKWLGEFPRAFRGLMCDAERVYLNSNEHKRATSPVPSRNDRFVRQVLKQYPLHEYHRLARLLYSLRVVKSAAEIELLRIAVEITARGYRRVMAMLRPGVAEYEIEAEFAHEFIRSRAKFAYEPIIAAGANACVLHYGANDQICQDGQLVLMDVAASYANYNADVTRTFPANGRFTPRQLEIYDTVLRVMRASCAGATVGKLHRDWTREAQRMMNDELLRLGLIKQEDIDKQTLDEPACRKYFMHGLGHPLGLDVHDVGLLNEPFAPGWVLTVEPGIYLPDEGFGVRLENDVLVTEHGPVDLTPQIPVEADEIERIMGTTR
jgi:Xaa-Pro aminopeptidase